MCHTEGAYSLNYIFNISNVNFSRLRTQVREYQAKIMAEKQGRTCMSCMTISEQKTMLSIKILVKCYMDAKYGIFRFKIKHETVEFKLHLLLLLLSCFRYCLLIKLMVIRIFVKGKQITSINNFVLTVLPSLYTVIQRSHGQQL